MGQSLSLLVRVRNHEDPPPEDHTPPVIAWRFPEPGAEVSGTIALRFDALDNVGIDSLRIYRNGYSSADMLLNGEDEATYNYMWNTKNDSDGVYIIEVRAWDAAGNIGISPTLIVHVSNNEDPPPEENDTTPPDVWWTAPEAGATLSDTVRLRLRYFDEESVDSIKLVKDGAVVTTYLQEVSQGLLEYLWDTASDSDGVHIWEARAWDDSGNMGQSLSLLVRAHNNDEPRPGEDNTPPVIAWLSPTPGDTLVGAVNLRFQVIDDSPLDSVQVLLNGQRWRDFYDVGNFFDGDVNWQTDEVADGNYIVQVKAWDAYRNIGRREVIWFALWNNRPRVIWVPDEFETIQGAIDASVDGDTVRVRSGTYEGGIFFWDKNIWLESERGPELTIIDAEGFNFGISLWMFQDTTTCIRGFTIKNSEYPNISLENGCSIKLLNNVLTEPGTVNIWSGENRTIFLNNIFTQSENSNLYLFTSHGLFNNNMVIHSGTYAFWNRSYFGNSIIIDYSLIWDYQNLTSDPPFNFGRNNIIDQNPIFEGNSYILGINSPAVNAGNPNILDLDGSRSDIGIYGGPYAYQQP